jgi:dTDP-D-glucose 4,6-dehydratase
VTKAGQMLGWKPKYTLRRGVEEIYKWYMSERSWAKEVLTP